MISPIFTTVVIGFLAIMIYMKATTNRFNTGDERLIEEESRANSVRKKCLDDLDYITIPYEKLPFARPLNISDKAAGSDQTLQPDSDTSETADNKGNDKETQNRSLPASANSDEVLRQDENDVLKLHGSKIVNFTGISNTDLKAEYGAPNLTALTEYDQNFTALVKALDTWGGHLIDRGMTDDARRVLEFAVECRTDLKSTYLYLADIYADNFEFDKIDHIMEVAGGLNSLMKEPILRALKEKCDINQYVDKK